MLKQSISHLSNLDVGDEGGGTEKDNAELGEHFQRFFLLFLVEENRTKLTFAGVAWMIAARQVILHWKNRRPFIPDRRQQGQLRVPPPTPLVARRRRQVGCPNRCVRIFCVRNGMKMRRCLAHVWSRAPVDDDDDVASASSALVFL